MKQRPFDMVIYDRNRLALLYFLPKPTEPVSIMGKKLRKFAARAYAKKYAPARFGGYFLSGLGG